MAGQERIEQPRLEKLSRIISRGINPYPHQFPRTHTSSEAIELLKNPQHRDRKALPRRSAWPEELRQPGSWAKLHSSICVTARAKYRHFSAAIRLGTGIYELLHDTDLGDFIGVRGILFKTRITQDNSRGDRLHHSRKDPHADAREVPWPGRR